MTPPAPYIFSMSEQADLVTLANEVFKTPGEAHEWLLRPHPMLGGNAPLDVAKSVTGHQQVIDLLVAIKFGNLA